MRGPTDPLRQTTPPTAGEASIAGWDARIWARNLAIAAAAGVFLAFIGAMGTGAAPLGARLIYWTPLMVIGALISSLMAIGLSRLMPARANLWLYGAVLSLAIALPITLLVWGYTNLFLDGRIGLPELPGLFGGVVAISTAMTAVMILVNRPGAVTHAPPPGAPAAQVRFMERLPPKLKGAVIYAVQSEDHYLRLHTSKGSDLILMRLADAVVELEGLEGAQVHRSWWVARDAVTDVKRGDGRATLTLSGGVEAPVSRAYAKALREAGWF